MHFPNFTKSMVCLCLVMATMWFAGCGSDGNNPVATSGNQDSGPGGQVNLSFRLAVPPGWHPATASDIKAQVATPSATFKLILFNISSVATSTLTKTVDVVSNTAMATFTNLPAWPVVGKFSMSGATWNNASSFSGCLDLITGNNVMTLSPVDSNATTTVAAYVMEKLAENSANMAAAPAKLATAINAAISKLNFSLSSLLSDAVAAFQTFLGNSSTAAQNAVNDTATTNQIANLISNIALANVSDFSSLTTVSLSSIRNSITLPTLPTQPPPMPSGSPTIATTTVLGTSPNTTTINWYVYVSLLDPTSSWGEWKSTVVDSTSTLLTSYWQIAAPVAKNATSQTRGFSGSGWTNNNLVVYTIGTGTYQSSGAISASGTQVANVVVQGTPMQPAYNFDVSRAANGAASGSLVFNDGSTITFSKTASNPAALGTTATYTQCTGTINVTSPISRTMTFTSTIYGNNTMNIKVTTATITTNLTYSADGSGSGSVTGGSRSISLTWNDSGAATATITLLSATKVISTSVAPQTTNL
ncbi:MAG: hypothetical protein HQM09_06985 [Candidatus Riflebacteria bacterium]|nr:hypothetical protein [Candidatus Riflebacteria bacterium]